MYAPGGGVATVAGASSLSFAWPFPLLQHEKKTASGKNKAEIIVFVWN
jgi:hypothetical protein